MIRFENEIRKMIGLNDELYKMQIIKTNFFNFKII